MHSLNIHKSSHVHLLIFDLLGSLSCQLIDNSSINDLVGEVCLITKNAKLKLLLLLFHLFLRLEQYLYDMGESVLNTHLAEVLLFDLISCKLLASTTSTTIVFVASSRWLNHKKTEPLQVVVSCKGH